MITIEQIEFLFAGLLIGASLVLWGRAIRQYMINRRALSRAKTRAYMELFEPSGNVKKSQGKPRLYKV